MLLNASLNDTDKKIMLAEAVHTCEHIRNSMATIFSTTSLFKTFMEEKPISLGCSQSSDVLDMSLNRTSSIRK